MIYHDYYSLRKFPLRVKQRINYIDIFESDSRMNFNTSITSVKNNRKNIYMSTTLLNESTSTYYYDKNYSFEMLFQKYTDSSVNNIYYQDLI